jgi:hypothetical protein
MSAPWLLCARRDETKLRAALTLVSSHQGKPLRIDITAEPTLAVAATATEQQQQ